MFVWKPVSHNYFSVKSITIILLIIMFMSIRPTLSMWSGLSERFADPDAAILVGDIVDCEAPSVLLKMRNDKEINFYLQR